MECLIKAGITNFEVSLNTHGAINIIEEAAKRYCDEALVGAGTVMTEEEADAVINAGAKFIVAPNLSEKVINAAIKRNILVSPGVLSPSEIWHAKELGCPMVKLFPASTMGSNYIKQILSPLRGINIMAVGGIDYSNMDEYFNAGAVVVGVGSAIAPKELVKKRDAESLINHIHKYAR